MAAESGPTVLALNAGSSSLKFAVYGEAGHDLLLSGVADTGGGRHSGFSARDADGRRLDTGEAPGDTPGDAVAWLARAISGQGLSAPVAIGHRIVHGGLHCRQHARVDADLLRKLEAAVAFAPLHVPPALELLRAATAQFPAAAQVACLDTAFHASLPALARTLPIPAALRDMGLERFGFHGLSCESILAQLGPRPPARLVIAHLGSGASLTAVAMGKSVDTSMGLTPSGGLMMATRCGDIDPGLLVYLARELGYDAARLETLVDQRSGLLGVSGLSGDLRQLRAAADAGNDAARLAIGMFTRSICKQVAAMATVLGGIDLLVFTGGIGEHDAILRDQVADALGWLAVGAGARLPTRVLPAGEEAVIARHAWRLGVLTPS